MTVDATLGGLIFSVVEPATGQEAAWRDWYLRDHFYSGAMAGPGVVAGAAWAATATWTPAAVTPAPGWYLGTYFLLERMLADYAAWSAGVLPRLAAQGRMFTDRRPVHRGRFTFTGVRRGPSGLAPISALDRALPTLVAALLPAETRSVGVPEPAAVGELGLQLEFAPLPGGVSEVAPPESRLVLAFSPAAELGCAGLAAAVAAIHPTDALWAASFRRLPVATQATTPPPTNA